jgi:hypothetical protein
VKRFLDEERDVVVVGAAPRLEELVAVRVAGVDPSSQTCEHCGTENLVAVCPQDARPFVLTTAHLEGRLREFDDGPVQQLPSGFATPLCDFCASEAAGLGLVETTTAGLRQKTCPTCRTDVLSGG